jgi:hypothetical protein
VYVLVVVDYGVAVPGSDGGQVSSSMEIQYSTHTFLLLDAAKAR